MSKINCIRPKKTSRNHHPKKTQSANFVSISLFITSKVCRLLILHQQPTVSTTRLLMMQAHTGINFIKGFPTGVVKHAKHATTDPQPLPTISENVVADSILCQTAEAKQLAESLGKAKQSLEEFMQTKLHYMEKELELKQKGADLDVRMADFEMKKRRDNLLLMQEEANCRSKLEEANCRSKLEEANCRSKLEEANCRSKLEEANGRLKLDADHSISVAQKQTKRHKKIRAMTDSDDDTTSIEEHKPHKRIRPIATSDDEDCIENESTTHRTRIECKEMPIPRTKSSPLDFLCTHRPGDPIAVSSVDYPMGSTIYEKELDERIHSYESKVIELKGSTLVSPQVKANVKRELTKSYQRKAHYFECKYLWTCKAFLDDDAWVNILGNEGVKYTDTTGLSCSWFNMESKLFGLCIPSVHNQENKITRYFLTPYFRLHTCTLEIFLIYHHHTHTLCGTLLAKDA